MVASGESAREKQHAKLPSPSNLPASVQSLLPHPPFQPHYLLPTPSNLPLACHMVLKNPA
jgi:hypothetical protein